ncbi:hypothetical protein [uncultured Draconibacterium sp.]|uniref:HD domain-containing protein n=1 Tax=uncultured Draconibacterium sp. TaxID=1573823 RepID=UPI0029C99062|nr:hypothetical protein [uncultured Draconibacterium sp.]
MSWIDTTYEREMLLFFKSKLGDIIGKELFEKYTSIRIAMEEDGVFGEIKGKEPGLTDHSEKHVKDVLERAYQLIGDFNKRDLTVYEVYILALMILFHDLGNISGRTNHDSPQRIMKLYSKYRINHTKYKLEKRVIANGASAHSGKSKNQCYDTLKFVDNNSSIENGYRIRLQELAAILRFADELAEGPQRTCSFAVENNDFPEKDNIIYHEYALITNIFIDRQRGRISVTYCFDIDEQIDEEKQANFKELLKLTFRRCLKLELERRYSKYHSEIIKPFKEISIKYDFNIDNNPDLIDFDQIIIEDKYPVPDSILKENKGDDEVNILTYIPELEPDSLISKINSLIEV